MDKKIFTRSIKLATVLKLVRTGYKLPTTLNYAIISNGTI